MEIVINDTNILIDLFNAGLLNYCRQLNLEFRTLDVIMEEICVESQREAVNQLVADGTLKVYSLTGNQVAVVYNKVASYEGVCNLSPQDISVMVYAIDNNCRLLTGDKILKENATLENVKVSGVLFITDMLTENGIVEASQMIRALERLLDSNSRLPKRFIRERIEALHSTLRNPATD